MKVNGLVLAAGMSRRMGSFKPLMKIGSKTMIETVVDQMLKVQVQQIVVVLGYRGEEIQRVLEADACHREAVKFVYNTEYERTEMLDSVKLGLAAMSDCDWFFTVPGDMPAISADTYRMLREQAAGCWAKVLFPVLDGYRKHPPLVSSSCRKDILQFQGNGLRELWKQYDGRILEVPLKDMGCTIDVDNPMDYKNVCRYMAGYSYL